MTAAYDPAKHCGATCKSHGRPCPKGAMANGRCYIHGGATPCGEQSANHRHGQRVGERNGKTPELTTEIKTWDRRLKKDKTADIAQGRSLLAARVRLAVQKHPDGLPDQVAEAVQAALTTTTGLAKAEAAITESMKAEQPISAPVFQVVTGDDWNRVPFQERAADGSLGTFLDLDGKTFQLIEVQPQVDGDGVTRLVPLGQLAESGEPR